MLKPNSFAERLNLCLDKEGFPPKHKGRIQLLSQLVGLTHRGASKWLNGECTPPNKKYPILAKQLNVNEAWLKTGVGAMYDDQVAMFISNPLGIEQSIPIYAATDVLSTKPHVQKTIQCILPYRGVFYGVFLNEQAMSPRFPAGSLLILDRYAEPKDGDFVLVSQQGQSEPLFRQFCTSTERTTLQALHPEFEPLIFTDHHDMIGKLVQAIVSF